MAGLDTTYHGRRLRRRLKNLEFRVEFDRARCEIHEIDSSARQRKDGQTTSKA
jgi:hypothetical protein